MAEQRVRRAAGRDFETVVVRPRLVWGPGDTTLLPPLIQAMESGRFAWIGGGRHLTSTTHVDNVVEGLLLGAERGRSGEAYFVTDGEPVQFREFITRLVATRGIEAPDKEMPAAVAGPAAAVAEKLWSALPLPRRAARDAPGRVALVPGVHAGYRKGEAGAGLQAGHCAR